MFQHIGSLAVKMFGAAITYLLTIYISRYAGNETVGYFHFFLSYSLIFTLIMKFGTDLFLMKWVSQFTADGEPGKARFLYSRLFVYHLLTGGIITLAGLFITPVIFPAFFERYTHISFFQVALISVFFVNLHIMNYEFLRGKQRVVAYTFYHTTSIFLITLILSFGSQFIFIEPVKLEICYLAAAVISFVLSTGHVWKFLKNEQSVPVEGFEILSVLTRSFPYFSNNAVFILIGTLDVFILSKYVNPADIGEYALLVKFATFISFPMVVLSANFAPKMLHYTDTKLLQGEMIKMTRLIATGAFLILACLTAVLPFIMSYLKIEGSTSLWIFLFIGAGYLFSAVCALNEASLLMLGEEKLYQKIMLSALVFNFVLNLLLIPLWHELGAAITTMLTLLFWNVTAVYFARKKLALQTSLIF
jgi:O-antigen/teichoic acid export membrane protein